MIQRFEVRQPTTPQGPFSVFFKDVDLEWAWGGVRICCVHVDPPYGVEDRARASNTVGFLCNMLNAIDDPETSIQDGRGPMSFDVDSLVRVISKPFVEGSKGAGKAQAEGGGTSG